MPKLMFSGIHDVKLVMERLRERVVAKNICLKNGKKGGKEVIFDMSRYRSNAFLRMEHATDPTKPLVPMRAHLSTVANITNIAQRLGMPLQGADFRMIEKTIFMLSMVCPLPSHGTEYIHCFTSPKFHLQVGLHGSNVRIIADPAPLLDCLGGEFWDEAEAAADMAEANFKSRAVCKRPNDDTAGEALDVFQFLW